MKDLLTRLDSLGQNMYPKCYCSPLGVCDLHYTILEAARDLRALDRVKAYIKRARSFQLEACSKDYILHGILNDIENEIAGKPKTSLGHGD